MSTFGSDLMSFAMTSLVMELTPGPNMGYLALLAAGQGRRAGLAAVGGVALGLLIAGMIAALGLAALIAELPALYQILRWGGVAYLLWIAWEGWRGEADEDGSSDNDSLALHFRRGLITNLLNPKAALFYVAVLPGFVSPAAPVLPQTVVLSLIYVAIATGVHGAIVVLAGSVSRFLADERRATIARKGLSLLLAAIALWLAWSTRQ